MWQKVKQFITKFRYIVELGLIVKDFKWRWCNPEGYGLRLKLGLTIVKPLDED